MKATFNCSCIKEVCLNEVSNFIELEVQYTIARSCWIARQEMKDEAMYVVEDFRYAYERISDALINGEKFVSVEIQELKK